MAGKHFQGGRTEAILSLLLGSRALNNFNKCKRWGPKYVCNNQPNMSIEGKDYKQSTELISC